MNRQKRKGLHKSSQGKQEVISPIDELLKNWPKVPASSSDQQVSGAKPGVFENTSAGISLASALIATVILIGLIGILSFTWDHYSVWIENICAEKGGQP